MRESALPQLVASNNHITVCVLRARACVKCEPFGWLAKPRFSRRYCAPMLVARTAPSSHIPSVCVGQYSERTPLLKLSPRRLAHRAARRRQRHVCKMCATAAKRRGVRRSQIIILSPSLVHLLSVCACGVVVCGKVIFHICIRWLSAGARG